MRQDVLRPWSYANPFKAGGKELCDLIVVRRRGPNLGALFENTLYLFFDCGQIPLPLHPPAGAPAGVRICLVIASFLRKTHEIIVEHGAKEAYEQYSARNVYGSLGISYEDQPSDQSHPFTVPLSRSDPVHLLYSHILKTYKDN